MSARRYGISLRVEHEHHIYKQPCIILLSYKLGRKADFIDEWK